MLQEISSLLVLERGGLWQLHEFILFFLSRAEEFSEGVRLIATHTLGAVTSGVTQRRKMAHLQHQGVRRTMVMVTSGVAQVKSDAARIHQHQRRLLQRNWS